jgi:hypothetical protein
MSVEFDEFSKALNRVAVTGLELLSQSLMDIARKIESADTEVSPTTLKAMDNIRHFVNKPHLHVMPGGKTTHPLTNVRLTHHHPKDEPNLTVIHGGKVYTERELTEMPLDNLKALEDAAAIAEAIGYSHPHETYPTEREEAFTNTLDQEELEAARMEGEGGPPATNEEPNWIPETREWLRQQAVKRDNYGNPRAG